MLGAIVGDVIGSVYERHGVRTTDFPLLRAESTFTDDTVLSVATAEVLLRGGDYAAAYRSWFRRFPERGYGDRFREWAAAEGAGPYGSLGNGSAMRVSPVAWAFDTLEEVLAEARRSAAVTHDHPEGIRGAQAVAAATFLARTGAGKGQIRATVEESFAYDLSAPLDAIRPTYRFDATCPGSVPQALRAFLEATDFESAVRLAVSLGGDSDTLACMAGAVAEAYYGGVPAALQSQVLGILPQELAGVVRAFAARFGGPGRR